MSTSRKRSSKSDKYDNNSDGGGGDVTGPLNFEKSLTLTVAEIFYPVYGKYIKKYENYVNDIERDLSRANIRYPVEMYISALIGYGMFAGAFMALIGTVLAFIFLSAAFTLPDIPHTAVPFGDVIIVSLGVDLINILRFPLISLLIGLAGGLFGVAISLTVGSFWPQSVASRRARKIDLLMSDSISYMYSLSVGGLNQIKLIQAIAEAEDTYGEVSVEFQRIALEMDSFKTDYQTAVENVSEMTPSDELTNFLQDMLSVINSGGDMTSFLETHKELAMEEAKKKQEKQLDTMEFFGEMYLSLSILPMGLLIALTIFTLMGEPLEIGLYITVYGIIPILNILFGIILASVKVDTIGSGELKTDSGGKAITEDETRVNDMSLIDNHSNTSEHKGVFQSIKRFELQHRLTKIFQSPWEFFRIRPTLTLGITIPASLLMIVLFVAVGVAEPSFSTMTTNSYVQTVLWFYLPAFVIISPLAFFTEWNRRTRGKITNTLTSDLRKLKNANETGQPLLEAIRITAEGKDTVLADEFNTMYKKTQFGTSLSPALIEFNNKYKIPRIARTVKLIEKAQEASSNITQVLQTAARSSQYQDELDEERITRTRMQVMIIAVTFFVFLVVIAVLQVFFVDRMANQIEDAASLGAALGGSEFDPDIISMFFFHAVTLQAASAGAISGYMQTGKLKSSYKYIVGYLLITIIGWGIALSL